jgi:hypothetical protein
MSNDMSNNGVVMRVLNTIAGGRASADLHGQPRRRD